MKKAIIYTRVSTDEQKENGFSLPDQLNRILKYCSIKNYNVVAHYQEDHSAKDFNRPQFKMFLNDLKSKKINPDVFVCVRMDRFTRNAIEGYNMIMVLKKQGIEFETIESNISLDTPEELLPFFINMLLPQIDNERRGLNTKRGMRQAVREGRFPWKAPIGYLNDPINKGMLIVDTKRAPFIKFLFETYGTGLYGVDQIKAMLKERGLKTVKQNLYNILRQPLYTGKIKLEAWKDEPEEIYQGLHEAIIDEGLFNICNDILSGKKRKFSKPSTRKENLPLRGFLRCCRCGSKLTGSNSRSRNGSLHSYYHCQHGCKERFRADEANELFVKFLSGFEPSEDVKQLYSKILADVFKTNQTERNQEKKSLEEQIESLQKRIHTLNDKYFDGVLDDATYKEAKARYETLKNDLVGKHMALQPEGAALENYLRFASNCISNIGHMFEKADFEGKQLIIGSIFPDNLIFKEKNYRTTKVNEVIKLICSIDKAFQENRNKKVGKIADLSILAPPVGLEPTTL